MTAAHHETPDLAELRRLAEAATPGPWAARYGVSWEARVCATTGSLADVDSTANAELIAAAVNALPGLLDAAAERDRLARLLDEPRRSGCAVEIAGVRIAPCDERGQTADMRERDTLADRLAHMTEARDNARAEVKRLTALVEAVREDARNIARDSGGDKGCYGVDFWAGMCKAAARIDSRIRHALDGLSHVDYLDDDGRKQRGRAVRAETEMERIAAERDALAAKVERVRALADEWTYNGEFGWDDGSHTYGPDCEGQALDYAAAKLRRALDEEPQP